MGPGQQAGFQILCLVVCFLFASISGVACATVVRVVNRLGETEAFVDSALWEVPELEIPFYYDHRGEINRDILLGETHKTSLPIEIEEAGKEAESSGSDESDEDLLDHREWERACVCLDVLPCLFFRRSILFRKDCISKALVGETPTLRVSLLDRIDEGRLVSLSAAAAAEDRPLETVSEATHSVQPQFV